MADWIKFEATTPDKPEVVRMASALGIDQDAVVGKLLRLWVWADQNSVEGVIRSPNAFFDRITFCPGFAAAMKEVGWLVELDGGLALPNFDRHNGKTAKLRAESNRRVAAHRAVNGNSSGNVNVTSDRECIPRPVRRVVADRHKNTCAYCDRKDGEYGIGETKADGVMAIDHVIPLASGGENSIENMVLACTPCNRFKGNRTPDECGLKWPVDEFGNRFGVTSALQKPLPDKIREDKKKEQKITPVGDLLADISPQVATDFRALRNKLRAPITETAMAGIRREAGKAGMTLEAALSMCCERGWRGFKAEWVNPTGRNGAEQPSLPRLQA